ncbi:MAG: aldehyde dehydrogenase family protein [Solirubrobacterales bacterium]|nr:aldehyde dehydrogenase family protein [Solirubrobacterales bacterium]
MNPATLARTSQLFIGGAWVDPATDEAIEVVNATTEEVMGSVPAGTASDVDAAVAAANAAAEPWSELSPNDRAAICTGIGARLQDRAEEIASLISQELGSPLQQSLMIQAGLPAITFMSMEHLVEHLPWEETIGNSLIVREPVGTVGAITPWNYPLHQIAAKVAPAMTAGCTIVVKPSEVAPLSAFILAEIMEEVGVPPGVFNLVTGTGPVVGEAIVTHAGIDAVSFTGSTVAGRRVSELAAASVKPVTLELGGKSANLILDDADLETAVVDGIQKCFINSGQTCSALTRMLVPREALPTVEAIVQAAIDEVKVGDPSDPKTTLGPLVSDIQRERVRGLIKTGIEEGARLVCGGSEAPEGLDTGYFVKPTVFSDVTPGMTIAQEEVFGPVLVIMAYEDEDDAISLANATRYGLAGGVWSADEERAKRVARRMDTGQVEINGGVFNPLAPFGGRKMSGHGRELGPYGIEDYLSLKSMQL